VGRGCGEEDYNEDRKNEKIEKEEKPIKTAKMGMERKDSIKKGCFTATCTTWASDISQDYCTGNGEISHTR
jgi:hypothetical protein